MTCQLICWYIYIYMCVHIYIAYIISNDVMNVPDYSVMMKFMKFSEDEQPN